MISVFEKVEIIYALIKRSTPPEIFIGISLLQLCEMFDKICFTSLEQAIKEETKRNLCKIRFLKRQKNVVIVYKKVNKKHEVAWLIIDEENDEFNEKVFENLCMDEFSNLLIKTKYFYSIVFF